MNEQLLQKAKAAKSAEELQALAKAEGRELTEEKAAELFQKLSPPEGELSDDELENVAGGGCGGGSKGTAFPVGTRFRLTRQAAIRHNYPGFQIAFDEARQEVVCTRSNCGNSLFVVVEIQEDFADGHIGQCTRCGCEKCYREDELIRA